jgi:hypothetical protein
MQGIIQVGDRNNPEHIQEIIPDSEYQSLPHFISDSPWDAQEVMNWAARKSTR